jgi:dCMP deaminase
MAFAELAATRSHDPDTKHGAVIVDAKRRILGIGYNGFPRGGNEACYSTDRPDKYAVMVHAELNAILNCHARPEGATLYVTGCPCPRCMLAIIQAGIIRVVFGPRISVMVGDDERGGVSLLARNHGVELVEHPGEGVRPLLAALLDRLSKESR